MSTPVIKGNQLIIWGAAGTYTQAIIVSARNQLTGEMVEVPDNNGFAVAAIFFNDKQEMEVEFIIQTSAPTPARGDSITIAGIVGYCTETETMWSQKDVAKMRLRATKWANF